MTESKLKKLFNIIKEKFKLLGKYIKNKIAEMKAKIKNIIRYGKDKGKEINSNIDKINKIIPKLEKIDKETEEAYWEISSLENKLFIEKETNRGDRDEEIEKIENIIASKSKLYDKLSRENNKLRDEYQNLDLTNVYMFDKKSDYNNFEKYGRYKDDNQYKYGFYAKSSSKTESTIISKEELKFIIKECYIEIQMDNIDLIA